MGPTRQPLSEEHEKTLAALGPELRALLAEAGLEDTGSALDMDTSDAVWADLDQQLVGSSLNLPPYSSQVLIDVSDPLFADGFEGGDAAQWSSATP